MKVLASSRNFFRIRPSFRLRQARKPLLHSAREKGVTPRSSPFKTRSLDRLSRAVKQEIREFNEAWKTIRPSFDPKLQQKKSREYRILSEELWFELLWAIRRRNLWDPFTAAAMRVLKKDTSTRKTFLAILKEQKIELPEDFFNQLAKKEKKTKGQWLEEMENYRKLLFFLDPYKEIIDHLIAIVPDLPKKIKIMRERLEGIRYYLHQSHLGLVFQPAIYYFLKFGGRIPLWDIFQEGTLALDPAIARFDIYLGYKFTTFAVTGIKQKLVAFGGKELSKTSFMVSSPWDNEGTNVLQPIDPYSTEPSRLVQLIVKLDLIPSLGKLPAREKQILDLRYKEGKTLEQVGTILRVTKERVRQLEKRAIDMLRKLLGEEVEEEPKKKFVLTKQMIKDLPHLLPLLEEREKIVIGHLYGIPGYKKLSINHIVQKLGVSKSSTFQIRGQSMGKIQKIVGVNIHPSDPYARLFLAAAQKKQDKRRLPKLFEALNDRDREITGSLWGLPGFKKQTHEQLAKQRGVGKSYIRKLENRAIARLQGDLA